MNDCEDSEKVMRLLFEYDACMQAEERKRHEKINVPDDIMIKAIKQAFKENGLAYGKDCISVSTFHS